MDEKTKTSSLAGSVIPAEGGRHTTGEIFEIILHRRWLVVGVVIGVLFLTGLNHFLRPSYSVKAFLFADSDQETSGFQELLSSLGGKEGGSYNEAEAEKQLLLLKTPEFYRKLAGRLRELPEFATMTPLLKKEAQSGLIPFLSQMRSDRSSKIMTSDVELGEVVSERVRVAMKSRGIIGVQFATGNPDLTVFLTNAFLQSAVKSLSDRDGKRLQAASDYIQNKIKETVAKMEITDRDIVTLSTKNANVSLLAPQNTVAEKLLQLKVDLEKHRFSYEQNRRTIESLKKKQTEGTVPPLPGVAAPVAGANEGIYGLGKTIANLEVENELLQNKIGAMQKGLDELLKSNLSLPKHEQMLADLKRQKGLDYYVFDNLFKTHLQLEVRGVSLLNRVYPVQYVSADEVYLTNRLLPKLVVMLLISLIFVSASVYGWHLLSPVVRTRRDFDALDLSFLGSVSKIDPAYFKSWAKARLLRFDVESKETIPLKHMRSRLIHLSAYSGAQARKVACLLSYGNGEGKTFISSNLAACLGFMGRRTLLIDFDLRRASLSSEFGLAGHSGVCEYLETGSDVTELIHSDVAQGLDLLPAGRFHANTAEKITNQRLSALLEACKSKYDFIVVDTAPLLVAPESMVIAKESDFAVLVATSWKTKREHVQDAIDEIRQVRRSSIHFILNKMKDTHVSLVSNYYSVSALQARKLASRVERASERSPERLPERPLDN